MSATPLDLLYTYQFIKRLATPFKDWDAFKLGIIDENGKVLRKRATLKTPEEKSAWGLFDRLVANLKKLLGKVPGGKTRIASYAAALLLLRENNNKQLDELDEDELYAFLNEELEEEIANVVGGGNVAGLGVGSQGEPPKSKKTLVLKKMLKRKQNV